MTKIDGFMNRTRRTNDKDTMNAVLNESDDNEKKRDIKLKMCYYIQNKIRW